MPTRRTFLAGLAALAGAAAIPFKAAASRKVIPATPVETTRVAQVATHGTFRWMNLSAKNMRPGDLVYIEEGGVLTRCESDKDAPIGIVIDKRGDDPGFVTVQIS